MSQTVDQLPANPNLEAAKAMLERANALIDAVPKWLRVAAGVFFGLLGPTWMVNDYLKGFGQPGLGAFGDNLIIGILQAAGLVFALLVALIGMILAAPLFTRFFFAHQAKGLGFADHVNSPMLGAAKTASTNDFTPRPVLAYFAANASLVALAVIQGLQPYVKCLQHPPFWLAPSLLTLSPLGALLMVLLTIKPANRSSWASGAAMAIGFAFAMSAWSWVSSVDTLLTPNFSSDGATDPNRPAFILLVACGVHFALSAASHNRRATVVMIILAILSTLAFTPGSQMLIFNALRASNAGGGVVDYYPAPARKTLGGPLKSACLILTAGEYRIVRLTDDPEDCSAVRMRFFYSQLRHAPNEAVRRQRACGVMPIRRDAFAGALSLPAENGKTPDATAQTLVGCPPVIPKTR